MLLKDEEIPYKPENKNTEFWGDFGFLQQSIYKEGARAQLKKVVEWLNKPCPHNFDNRPDLLITDKKVKCFTCWQTLLKEASDG